MKTGWERFIRPAPAPADFLGAYAQHFDTVEVDSTYYRIPSESMVRNWRARTPPGFTFAAKFPQVITHEKVLQDCREELANFLRTMSLLEDRLGPLLLQFPYFNKKAFARPEDFLARLTPFLEELPGGFQYALEVRNKYWVNARAARHPAQEACGSGVGLVIVRILPVSLCNGIFLCIAGIYWRLNPARREVVVQNLLPALQGDRNAAEQTTRQVFRQMALKIADLWRFESALLRPSWLNEQKDWDRFEAVHARGQGMLLITPHLGNWELGGPLLAHHGYKLLVLTQPEPGGLTELRKVSRAKWGIETLVIGDDGFAFVEIIKRTPGRRNCRPAH